MSHPTLVDIVERIKRNESDPSLQGLLEEALQQTSDSTVLRQIAKEHFHSFEIGRPVLLRLLELNPRGDEVMAMLAGLHAMHIDIEPAREWANKALRINARNLEALYALSTTYFEPAERLQRAEEMLAIDEHFYPAILHKAEALASMGQPAVAKQVLTDHIEWLRSSSTSNPAEIEAAGAALALIAE